MPLNNSDLPWNNRPIKSVSAKQLELALSSVLTELTGKNYRASIIGIDYNPENNAWLHDISKIEIEVEREKEVAPERTAKPI